MIIIRELETRFCFFSLGNSVLMRSEQSAYNASSGGSGNVSIDMDLLQRDQMQLLEQQV